MERHGLNNKEIIKTLRPASRSKKNRLVIDLLEHNKITVILFIQITQTAANTTKM